MVVSEIFYGIECNRCRRMYEGSEDHEYFSDEFQAEESAEENDWKTIGHRHYCPNCYTEDKDGNVVVKEGIPKAVFRIRGILNASKGMKVYDFGETESEYLICHRFCYEKLSSTMEALIMDMTGQKAVICYEERGGKERGCKPYWNLTIKIPKENNGGK